MLAAAAWLVGWKIADPQCVMPTYQPGGPFSYSELLAEYTVDPFCLQSVDPFLCSLPILGVVLVAVAAAITWIITGRRERRLTVAFGAATIVLSSCACWEMIV